MRSKPQTLKAEAQEHTPAWHEIYSMPVTYLSIPPPETDPPLHLHDPAQVGEVVVLESIPR